MATKKKQAAKPKAPKKAAPAKAAPEVATLQTRLALDRFLTGLWNDRDLTAFLASKAPDAKPLAGLAKAQEFDRPREGEKLRKALFGRERPSEIERFEALLRQGIDCAAQAMPVLPELQHDLLAHSDIVAKDDARYLAMKVVSEYAAASQVHVAVQVVGRLAEATTDRVANARKSALAELRKLLPAFPYLMP